MSPVAEKRCDHLVELLFCNGRRIMQQDISNTVTSNRQIE